MPFGGGNLGNIRVNPNFGGLDPELGDLLRRKPGLVLDPNLIRIIGGGFVPGGTGTPAPGTPVTGTPVTLPPPVNDGDIITSEYINALRTAILSLADAVGAGPAATETLCLPPLFTMNGSGPAWTQSNGVATKGAQGNAEGAMTVNFPDGVRIQSMTVVGRKTGTVGSFSIKMLRVLIAEGSNKPLITMLLKTAGDPYNITQTVQDPQGGPAALEELRRVDNTKFSYMVTASLLGATDDAQINAIQVTYMP